MKIYLALGPMPKNASPAAFFASGPWCFSGQEKDFENWEETYTFAPEPLANQNVLPKACKMAQALSLKIIPLIVSELGEKFNGYPNPYWETLLIPWAISFASQITERYLRVNAMIEIWGNKQLVANLLPENTIFNFQNEADFNLRGLLGINYNWWLFSRLLEKNPPLNWQLDYEKSLSPISFGQVQRKTIFADIRHFLKKLLLKMPFPRLKGMSFFQSLTFSAALLHGCKNPDSPLSIFNEFNNPELIRDLCNENFLLTLIRTSLPESIKLLTHPKKWARSHKSQKIKIASITAYEDCVYRQALAIWKANGNRLAWVQHGGNYGQIKVACNAAMVEYAEDVFFTWGWNKQEDLIGNFVPMPYPQLQNIRNHWQQKSDVIIFAGTEMACFSYRLESRPTPLQFIAYRNAKKIFLDNCSSVLRKRILYRPYFTLPGLLEDGPWITARFPEVKICKGQLLPQMLQCSLLILDHHGTTMLEGFAANIPMILYWDPAAWPLSQECVYLLKELHKHEIWHPDPESAAQKLREIANDPQKWWLSSSIQKCVKEYCKFQAWTLKSGIDYYWWKTLSNL